MASNVNEMPVDGMAGDWVYVKEFLNSVFVGEIDHTGGRGCLPLPGCENQSTHGTS